MLFPACSLPLPSSIHLNNDLTNDMAHEFLTEISNQIANDLAAEREAAQTSASSDDDAAQARIDILRFHDRCGKLVKLSNSRRSAERERPLDEFNNGVVMTNRAIQDNEIFEVCFSSV